MCPDKNRDAADGNERETGPDNTLKLGPSQEASEIPGRYAASLVIKRGVKKGAEYSITGSRTVIGRGTDADIILDDPAVSRMHAAIEFLKTKFVLKDMGSTNGTLIDGKSVKHADLTHGDRFQIGDTIIEFVLMEKPGDSVYVID